MIKYLVTGTGRCGTVYMARLFTSLGVMCGHEAIFGHDGLDSAVNRLCKKKPIETSYCSTYDLLNKAYVEQWFNSEEMMAESSFLAAPFLDIPELNEVKIIHLVRNPLKVVNSLVKDINFFSEKKEMRHWTKLVYSVIPSIRDEKTEIEKACRYYIEWNKMIERFDKCLFLRVEDQPNKKLFEFLSINYTNHYYKNNKINSWNRNKKLINLRDIPEGGTKEEFMNVLVDYGYLRKTQSLYI